MQFRVWGAGFSGDKFRAGNMKSKLGSSGGYVHGFVFWFRVVGLGITVSGWGSGVGRRHWVLHAPCKFLGLRVRGSKEYSLRVKGGKGIRVNGSRT